jgi:hypothetical protein
LFSPIDEQTIEGVQHMQEIMFVIPIPPLLALGFLIGIILLVLGYMEKTNPTRHQHLMGLGIIIIGIMIPITPLSWYGTLIITRGLILGVFEIAVIVTALMIGAVLLYIGSKTYIKSQ